MITKTLTLLTALLILAARLVRPVRGYRCAGDLVRWETVTANGRKVELFRWLK